MITKADAIELINTCKMLYSNVRCHNKRQNNTTIPKIFYAEEYNERMKINFTK